MATWPGCQPSWRTGENALVETSIIILFKLRLFPVLLRTDVIFTGYDIVPGNVEGHKKKFDAKPWKFEVRFFPQHGLRTKQPASTPLGARHSGRSYWEVWHHPVKTHPPGDCFDTVVILMILSQHLKTRDIERVVDNFVQSGSTFLLTSNFPAKIVRSRWNVYGKVKLQAVIIIVMMMGMFISEEQWVKRRDQISLSTCQPSPGSVFLANTCETILMKMMICI